MEDAMPKTRSIDANFWNDPDVAKLTRDERLLLIAMITTCADDSGRLMAHPAYLRKMAFGFDDGITTIHVKDMRDHILACCRNALLYIADEQEYIYLRNFGAYQRIRYQVASKLPAPPAEYQESAATCGNLAESSTDSPSVVLCSVEKSSVDVEATGTVFKAWQSARGGATTAMDVEIIGDLIDEFTAEWVTAAIKEANSARQDKLPSINFLRAILDRWKRQGFKAPFDAKANREKNIKEDDEKKEAERTKRKMERWNAQHGIG